LSTDDEQIQEEFRAAQSDWRRALEGHRLAPPDAGFSARLHELAKAAHAEALVCWKAHEAGFEWPRHRATGGEPPYELRPGSGRRGPDAAWARFDAAVDALNRAASQTNIHRVGSAYEEMAVAADTLSIAIEEADRASGLLPRTRATERRRQQRRSA